MSYTWFISYNNIGKCEISIKVIKKYLQRCFMNIMIDRTNSNHMKSSYYLSSALT